MRSFKSLFTFDPFYRGRNDCSKTLSCPNAHTKQMTKPSPFQSWVQSLRSVPLGHAVHSCLTLSPSWGGSFQQSSISSALVFVVPGIAGPQTLQHFSIQVDFLPDIEDWWANKFRMVFYRWAETSDTASRPWAQMCVCVWDVRRGGESPLY